MNKMINRYKSKEGGTMIPAQFQKGGSNLFLTMPDGGTVGPMGASPMGLPEYQTGANLGGVNQKTMQDFDHYYSQGFPMMQEGGDADMDGEDQSFYSDRMNTFIQKIRDAAEKNLETAVMEQDQQQPMAAYGMSTGNDPMNSYNPGNLGAFANTANYLNNLGQNALSGYVQRMGALGPNDYYYKEKNIYKDTSKGAPLGTQTFTDANGNQSSISPEEAANRANYALYNKRDGGSLPMAQNGLSGLISAARDPELYRRAQEMGHNSIEDYKKSGWGYGENHPEYKPKSTYPSRVRIKDPRTVNATSGKPIDPNVDLKSGDYHTGVIGEIARASRAYNQNPQELIAIALQESNLGKTDPSYGHAIDYSDPEGRGDAYDLAFAKSEKDKLAASKGYGNDELRKLQAYNGLGSVYPSTEAEYHGFNMGSIYGVPLTNAGINMADNPLYGKRIVDLRDNVLGNPVNTEYNQFLDKYNRDLANEEAVSQKQIATYNLFNRINPKYGNEFADMLQNAYSDSISNSSNNEYIYPKKDLLGGYPIPNLDNTRQRNALDRFNKGIGQSFLYEKGGALTMYQQDINSGQPGTTEGDYWTAEETAYLKTLPKAQRDAIISKGDKGKEAYQTYRKANDKPTPSAPPVNKSSTPTQPSATANNTGTGVTTGTPSVTTTPPASTTTTTTPPAATGFEGWSKTIINGVEYAVNDKNQVVGYPYQMPTGPQSYNNSNPYGGYNPYGAYGSMRGRNLGVMSKNRLTPEFRENMLAGSYSNPQLLGVSEIKTRRAMDPGNRVKSITYSYGQPIPSGRTTLNTPASNNSTQTRSMPPAVPTIAGNVNPPALDPNDPRVISPAVKAAEDYTLRPNQNWAGKYQDLPDSGPIQNQAGPRDMPGPDVTYDPFVSGYVPRYNTYPDLDNSGNVSPVKVMANNTVPETDTDPYLDPATDPRGANYGQEEYPEDLVLSEPGKVVRGSDNIYYVLMPDGSIEKSSDRNVLRKKTKFAKGGSLHRFTGMYQDGGPFSVKEMSIEDMPEMVDQIVEPESNNTPMEFKPYEMTDADRVRAVDVGTEYEQLEPGDGMAPSFDVTTKRRKKRIGNPQKDLAAINFATKLFKGRDAAYANAELGVRSQASQVFNPMRSTQGNYGILSGDFMRGKKNSDGNDAFHSGFNTYAQMGGSMMQNLKEGDEVYLTEEQIDQIIKRGGKLSYL